MKGAAQTGIATVHDVIELALDPEKRLRLLFRREAMLERHLADVRAALEEARADFAQSNQLMARPRMELLRTRFAPVKQRRDTQ